MRSRCACGGAVTMALAFGALVVVAVFALRYTRSIETTFSALLDSTDGIHLNNLRVGALPTPKTELWLSFIGARTRCADLCRKIATGLSLTGCGGRLSCALHNVTCATPDHDASCRWRARVADMRFGDRLALNLQVPDESVVAVKTSVTEPSYMQGQLSNLTMITMAPVDGLLGLSGPEVEDDSETVDAAVRVLTVAVDNQLEPQHSGAGLHVSLDNFNIAWPLAANSSHSFGVSLRLAYASQTPAWSVVHQREFSLLDTLVAMQVFGLGVVFGVGRSVFGFCRTTKTSVLDRLNSKGRASERAPFLELGNDAENE